MFSGSIKWENRVLAIVNIPLKLNSCQFAILYPLKTQWNQVFREYKMETLTRNDLIFLQIHNTILQSLKEFLNIKMIKLEKIDRKSASSLPFKNTCLCTILPPPFCEMYTCHWIYLVWNNKYIWQWEVVLNFRFLKLLHNLKPLDSRHLWDQVNMSVIGNCWLYIAGHILEI